MLRLMRKHATNWLIKVILFAIVVVFIFWGVGSFRSQRMTRVASVNGQTITMEEYQQAYNALLDQYRQQFGNQLNAETLKLLRVEEQALNQLIDQRLILDEAKRLNLRVTDDQLAETIKEVPAFQSAGGFDHRRYRQVLQNVRMTPEEFEAWQREAMLIEAITGLVKQNVTVSDGEALAWFQWENAKIDIEYARFRPEDYKDVEVTEEEIKSYFDQNAADYKTEPQLKVRYVQIAPEAFAPRVEVTPEEIEAYYDLHEEEFSSPPTVEARHILLKAAPDAGQEAEAKVRARAEEIMAKARAGEDFAELARTYSEGPSKEDGGYLGTFSREEMVKPFADQAFAMKAGGISPPVRTQFGWHVIKVEQVNAAAKRSLAEAADTIRQKLAAEKQKAKAYEAAEAVYDATFEHDDLARAAAAAGMEARTTDFFTRRNPPAALQDPQAFAQRAFGLETMQISDIIELAGGFYLLQPVEAQPARVPELAEVRETVRADILADQRDESARQAAEALLADLKADRETRVEFKTTGFFKRNDPIPQVGYEREISTAAFELSADDPLPDAPLKGRQGYYVIRFKERQAPPMEEFDSQKERVEKMLLARKQNQALAAWLDDLRERSEVKTYKERLGVNTI